jgi:hypothetical protein
MAARSTAAPEKRPGFFSQLRTLYTFTQQAYRWLPFLLAGILLVGIAAGIGIGLLFPPFAIWSLVLWGITGLMLGVLGSLMTMTRLSTHAMYRKIDGMPGAAGHVLSTSLGRGWTASEMPVGVNPKTQEAVYRAIGRGGVVIVGEGARGRLTRLVNDERSKVQRVASGVSATGPTRCRSESSLRPSRRCPRRWTRPPWRRSSSGWTRSRSRSPRCRSRRASTRPRSARLAPGDPAKLGPHQHRPGRFVEPLRREIE